MTSIEVLVSGGNLTSPMKQDIQVADCAATGQASFLFYLPAGAYKVLVNALGANGQRVSYAVSDNVSVVDGNQTVVPVTCTPVTGSILIQWNCDNCGGSPSPSPTPTPTPFAPPPALFNSVNGLEVDDQGRVYLGGPDPSPQPGGPSLSNRVIRVLPDRTIESTTVPFYDAVGARGDLEIIGNKLYTPLSANVNKPNVGGNSTHEVSLTTFPGALTGEYLNTLNFGSYDVLGSDRNNKLVGFAVYTAMEDVFERSRLFTYDLAPDGGNYRPREIIFDKNNAILFTTQKGICTAPAVLNSRTVLPTLLQPVPTSLPAGNFGASDIAETSSMATTFVVNYDLDTRLYLYNQANGQTPSPIYDFGPDQPLKVEPGPGGITYVLVGKAGTLDSYRATTSKYRVWRMKYDAGTNTIAPVDSNPMIATY